MNDVTITWPMLVTVVSLLLGLMAVLWSRILNGEREQKKDVATIYERLLSEAEKRHEIALNLAQNYPRTDTLRATVDASLEPVKIQLSHVSDRVNDLRTDFHEFKQEQRA